MVAISILLSSALIAPIFAASIDPAGALSNKKVRHAKCEFILCSNDPTEQAALKAGSMDKTFLHNSAATTAWNSCADERTSPKFDQEATNYCNYGGQGFVWQARAHTCAKGHGCFDFPDTDGNEWDFKGTSDWTGKPSQDVFAHYKGSGI